MMGKMNEKPRRRSYNMEPNRNDSPHNGPKKPDDKKPKNYWLPLIIAVVAVLAIGSIYNMINESQYTQTTWTDFRNTMYAGQIVEAEIDYDRIIYLTKEESEKPAAQQKACYTGLPSSYTQM